MMRSVIACTLVAVVAAATHGDVPEQVLSATMTGSQAPTEGNAFPTYTFKISTENVSSSDASGIYKQSINQTGWQELRIDTNPVVKDDIQAQAAGFVEGRLTAGDISLSMINFEAMKGVGYWKKAAAYMASNNQYAMKMIKANPTDAYWQQVSLSYQQLWGMYQAYTLESIRRKEAEEPELYPCTWIIFVSVNAYVDLDDVNSRGKSTPSESAVLRQSHCSSLMKLKKGSTTPDAFFGHTTWSGFGYLLRTYKTYNLQYSINVVKSGKYSSALVSFSSYPLITWSVDDFYAVGSGLVVIETSNSVFNQTLFNNLTPMSLFTWVRVNVANRLSSTAGAWVNYFAKQNSGTYNNQYIVMDTKALTIKNPGMMSQFKAGGFQIIETWPVGYEITDVTDVVNAQTYWPSYNIPYSKKVFNILGYPAQVQKGGYSFEFFSYDHCFRANLFREYHTAVNTPEDLGAVLQSNEYKWNPLSQYTPYFAISCRGDLSHATSGFLAQQCFGGIDTKYTSASLWNSDTTQRTVRAISGPSRNEVHPDHMLPAFNFANTTASCPKTLGVPSIWAFDWQEFGAESPLL